MVLVDKSKGSVFFDYGFSDFSIHLLALGIALGKKGAKEQGDGKELSFHFVFIFYFCKIIEKPANVGPKIHSRPNFFAFEGKSFFDFVAPIHVQALDKNESVEETPFVLDSLLIGRLSTVEGISHYQQVANKAGMIKTDDEIQGVVLKGVDENYDWTYFDSYLLEGKTPKYTADERSTEVLVSKAIADKMLLNVGDDVRVWFIDKDMQARGRKFSVSGIFETGLAEFDARYVFADLKSMKSFTMPCPQNWLLIPLARATRKSSTGSICLTPTFGSSWP